MINLKKVKLSDISEVTMGQSPNGSTYNHEQKGLPLLNGPTEFGLISPDVSLYTTDSKRECKDNDLIFCVRGSTTGRMNWADRSYSLGRGVCAISGNDYNTTRYIYYSLCLHLKALLQFAGGGTFPNLTKDVINNFTIPFPENYIEIVSILSAYDKLIENNTRRIEILEEMAQRIYKEWFVDFKYSGHENNDLVDSELGMIPEGWEVLKVGEILKRLPGGDKYTKKNVHDEGRVIVVDQSTDELLGYHNNQADHNASPSDPIIIFGDHTCKMQLMIEPFSIGPNVIPFTSKIDIPINYIYHLVESLVETKEYKRHWNELVAKKVVISTDRAPEFSTLAKPMYNQINKLKLVNRNLIKTRDYLLPKLITGEVDVSDLDIDTGILDD